MAASKPSIHPQMERIYRAAPVALRRDFVGQSALAGLINVAPQMVNNWEKRGPSKAGLLQFQAKLGITATWVETGAGPMLIPSATAREPDAAYRVTADDNQGLGPLSTREVDVVRALRDLPDLVQQKTRIDLHVSRVEAYRRPEAVARQRARGRQRVDGAGAEAELAGYGGGGEHCGQAVGTPLCSMPSSRRPAALVPTR